ncbi:hypothetical protein GH714_007532 [Hevea brasiliensis]|uniref:Transposase MuDR plant domain-containing protein n=1 Tax=Hevea brasiliensis TaxID=3981 RepID=A0A6A6LXF9_HEVBR|nr:hypothetical protein GH714_007532 [Hevea brasiliensis]
MTKNLADWRKLLNKKKKRCPVEVHIGGKFTEGPVYTYVGGTVVLGGWSDCHEMGYRDIINKCKDDGEYEESDDNGFETPYTSDENDLGDSNKKEKKRQVLYKTCCDHITLEFVIGMVFENGQQFRDYVQKYAICNGYNIGW